MLKQSASIADVVKAHAHAFEISVLLAACFGKDLMAIMAQSRGYEFTPNEQTGVSNSDILELNRWFITLSRCKLNANGSYCVGLA